jgi:hypothetical protein
MDLHYFGSGYAEGHKKIFNPHSATTMSGQAMFRTNVKKSSSGCGSGRFGADLAPSD